MRERDCQRGRETYSAQNRVSEMESQRDRERARVRDRELNRDRDRQRDGERGRGRGISMGKRREGGRGEIKGRT